MKNLLLIIVLFFMLSSCKDSKIAQWNALGKQHIITLYSCDGHIIKQWTSTGNVSNETQSDGWYFMDVATGKLVEITGTLVIEVK
jgi:hypothetical protein